MSKRVLVLVSLVASLVLVLSACSTAAFNATANASDQTPLPGTPIARLTTPQPGAAATATAGAAAAQGNGPAAGPGNGRSTKAAPPPGLAKKGAKPGGSEDQPNPAPAPAEPTAAGATSQAASSAANCSLLDGAASSKDFNALLPGAAVQKVTYQTARPEHPAFSNDNMPVNETSCVYDLAHMSNSKVDETMQVTYWLDQPSQADAGAMAQAWDKALAGSKQKVDGAGDGAYYGNGRLFAKHGDTYITTQVTGNKVSTGSNNGPSRQQTLEKQVALSILGRLK